MIAVLILLFLGMIKLGVDIGKHGELRKESKHDGRITFVALIIVWTLYYFSGLFNQFV